MAPGRISRCGPKFKLVAPQKDRVWIRMIRPRSFAVQATAYPPTSRDTWAKRLPACDMSASASTMASKVASRLAMPRSTALPEIELLADPSHSGADALDSKSSIRPHLQISHGMPHSRLDARAGNRSIAGVRHGPGVRRRDRPVHLPIGGQLFWNHVKAGWDYSAFGMCGISEFDPISDDSGSARRAWGRSTHRAGLAILPYMETVRRNRLCVWLIILGLGNFLLYAVFYQIIGGDAVNGYIKSVDGEKVYYVRGHFIHRPIGYEQDRPRWVWVYSYLHSISIWPSIATVLLAMLALAKPHILATYQHGILQGSTLVTVMATLIVIVTSIIMMIFIWEFVTSL